MKKVEWRTARKNGKIKMENNSGKFKRFILKGDAITFVDWANVHGWEKSLKREIDPAALFAYLKSYSEIQEIRLYFGKDAHPKSIAFLDAAEKTGYAITTKEVKYILEGQVGGQKIYRRKCDFDIEICIDVHEAIEKTRTCIFFTGDGDFAPLYQKLIGLHKQVIVVYAPGHLGREVWDIKKGLFVRIASVVYTFL